MSEVCHDVQVEPHLQLSGELLHYKSAVHEDDARVDVRAAGNAFASLLVQLQLFGGIRVINIELLRSVFVKLNGAALRLTPLVFSSSGGMGKAATVTHRRLASLLI